MRYPHPLERVVYFSSSHGIFLLLLSLPPLPLSSDYHFPRSSSAVNLSVPILKKTSRKKIEMGLHSQLNDASSDSIPLLVVALIAASVNHLRSLLLWLFVSMGLPVFQSHDGVLDDVPLGSGLADLIVLSEQLNVNRDLSYKYSSQEDGSGAPSVCASDCVVCLCRLRRGQQVRRLDCRHVFHKECFDGWLDHFNFNCPLCRSPLVSEGRRVIERRRVSGDLLGWFGVR